LQNEGEVDDRAAGDPAARAGIARIRPGTPCTRKPDAILYAQISAGVKTVVHNSGSP